MRHAAQHAGQAPCSICAPPCLSLPAHRGAPRLAFQVRLATLPVARGIFNTVLASSLLPAIASLYPAFPAHSLRVTDAVVKRCSAHGGATQATTPAAAPEDGASSCDGAGKDGGGVSGGSVGGSDSGGGGGGIGGSVGDGLFDDTDGLFAVAVPLGGAYSGGGRWFDGIFGGGISGGGIAGGGATGGGASHSDEAAGNASGNTVAGGVVGEPGVGHAAVHASLLGSEALPVTEGTR